MYLGNQFDKYLKVPSQVDTMLAWLPHINGNALWTTAKRHPEFIQFILDLQAEPEYFPSVAFDVAIYRRLFRNPTVRKYPSHL
jgi:hypothetical protein